MQIRGQLFSSTSGGLEDPFKALIFDSWFRQFKGVVTLVTLKCGSLKVGDKIQGYHSKKVHTVQVQSNTVRYLDFQLLI